MVRVLFIQAQVKQYRLPFFTKLHAALLQDGIEMRVAYSDPPGGDRLKQDNVELPKDIGIKVPGYRIFGGRFLYQALLRQALKSDLVIAEQANRNLHNYVLLPVAELRHSQLAFWGLGRNNDLDRSKLSEWLRPWIARRADRWFTYTRGTADWLAEHRVPRENITVIQNSTDTQLLATQIAQIREEQVEDARRQLGIEIGSKVGVYCGILTPDKGITLLLEAARLVKERIPGFHLLILGGGPMRRNVEQAAAQLPWIHYLGPKFGEEKALFLKMGDCFLLPGRVGLAILDSFAAGLPLLTTKTSFHGPEVEYLEEGVNGKMTGNSVEEYAESIISVLSDPALLERLKAGACEAVKRYSIEDMVERCRKGILDCLNLTGCAEKTQDTAPTLFRADRG